MPDNTVDQALKLAAAGFHVIPIIPGDKRPPIVEWQNHATTDPETIRQWWEHRYQNFGMGIAPRQLPNGRWLFVIDIDEHNPNESGTETLRELEDAYGKLPPTLTCHSGSGNGFHLYFTAPHEIRNGKTSRLGPGIDIRGNGGQVCAPPTIHKTGNPYLWDLEHGPDTTEPADAPEWLLALLAPQEPDTPTTHLTSGLWDDLDDTPAGIYNRQNDWQQLLTADEWTLSHTDRTGEQHWTRPGKTPREGTSATVGYKNLPILKVFTSSINWLPEGTYSKFKYYAHRHHNGNMSDAARTIRQQNRATLLTATPADDPWPTPIPLSTEHPTPTFPLHTLPGWAQHIIEQVARNIQTPEDLPATLLLGAIATIRLGKTWITYPRQNWRQPTNLYVAVAVPPSIGKTPVKNLIFKPIEELEKQQIDIQRYACLEHNSEKQLLEKRQRNIIDEVTKIKSNDITTNGNYKDELQHINQRLAELTPPPTGQIFVDDITTEALGIALQETGGHIAIISAEGGIFDRIAGMYSDNGKSSLDLYLEGWSGGQYKVNRVRREPIHIPSANITIVCTIQPKTLDDIGQNKDMQGRGFLARFLLTQPSDNVGYRDRISHNHTSHEIETIYTNQIHRIYNTPHTELELTGQTSDIFADYDQHLENQLAPGQPLEHLAEWIGKLRSNIIRIAALLHHIWNEQTTTISETTIQQAIQIGNYYLQHAQKIADRWGATPTIAQAKTIYEWAERNKLKTFTVRDVYSANRRRFPTADDTRDPLLLLVERGWIRPLFDGPLVTGRRGEKSPEFATHPIIHSPSTNLTKTAETSENYENDIQVARHARHARTPACAQEEKSAMREVPRGGNKHLPTYLEISPHAQTDPCAHSAHGPQDPSTTPNPQTDTLQVIHRLLGLD